MGYYTINSKPIYITYEREKYLVSRWEDKNENLPASKKIARILKDSKESLDYSNFCFNFLDTMNKHYPITFNDTWFNFNINAENSKFEIWNLLYDYICYYGGGRLIDERDFEEKILDDYSCGGLIYPQGKNFIFEIIDNPKLSFKSLISKERRRVRIPINTHTVEKIEGNLESFEVTFKHFTLSLSKNITINIK